LVVVVVMTSKVRIEPRSVIGPGGDIALLRTG
jgi:hypothetical protein